jgi:transposase InsO family protein
MGTEKALGGLPARQSRQDGKTLPSVSTFAQILKRHGLVTPRRRRHRTPPSTAPLAHATGPNTLWCIDFKGDFVVGRTRCYPLTISDAFSRYLIACIALPNTHASHDSPPCDARCVRRVWSSRSDSFRQRAAIRSCGQRSVHAMTEVSIWWMKLGIRHERIEPGKPQQNGRHERMHLTLKQATAMPPESNRRAQQRAFDRFRADYNCVRPA